MSTVIPTQVKIRGKWKNVNVSARGYVTIGSVSVDGHQFITNDDEWEKLKKGPAEAWQAMLFKCFEKALKRTRREANTASGKKSRR